MDRRLAILLSAMAIIAGCTAMAPQLRAFDAARYGLGGCPAKLADRCAAIAGKTFMSYGPLQVEYHSPEGRSYLWVGDRIVKGYWYVIPGLFGGRLCYDYGGPGTNCDGDITKGDPGRRLRQGDPYGLAGREIAPGNLGDLSFRSNLDDVDRLYANTSIPKN